MTERTLPTGTPTFLFTDIEGSTALLERLGEHYADVWQDHNRLLRSAWDRHHGVEVHTAGDAFFVAFERVQDAIAAAVDAQCALASHTWPTDGEVRVRMGIHCGPAHLLGGDYVGMAVHEAARISAAAHGGQILLSQAVLEIVDVETRDLGVHRLKDIADPQPLHQVVHPGLPQDFPPLRTLTVVPNNLPIHVSPFLGRDEEIRNIRKAVDANRLVTLVGPGGVGKTRTALEAATDMVSAFDHGVWFVDLSGTTDPELVVRDIADPFHLPETDDLLGSLAEYLADKRLLLILDNCEHLLDRCAVITDLILHRSTHVSVLSTSREPLAIEGEVVIRLPPLSVPPSDAPAEDLVLSDSVRLFHDRASRANASLSFGSDDVAAVAEVCRRLDGIPLAIELAAARTSSLTPRQISRRLDDRFAILTTGNRNAPDRQRTLRAAIDWGFDQLEARGRLLFPRLSVFAGGFTLEAAEEVCGGNGLEPGDVVDALDRLVRRSMVATTITNHGESRYHLLETLGAYGDERLTDTERTELRDRHLSWFTTLLDDDRIGSLDELDPELDNIRHALQYATSGGRRTEGLKLAVALEGYWESRPYLREGLDWIESFYGDGSGLTDESKARALSAMASLAWHAGTGDRWRQELLAMPRTSQTAGPIAHALVLEGTAAQFAGRLDEAKSLLVEAQELHRQAGNTGAEAQCYAYLSIVHAKRGRHQEAQTAADRALAKAAEASPDHFGADVLYHVALGNLASRDMTLALERFTQAAAGYQRVGWLSFVESTKIDIAEAAAALGLTELARTNLDEALKFFADDHVPKVLRGGRLLLADLETRTGRYDAARYLLGDVRARWKEERRNLWLEALLLQLEVCIENHDVACQIFHEAFEDDERFHPRGVFAAEAGSVATRNVRWALVSALTLTHLARGQVEDACRHAESCLRLARGDDLATPEILDHAGRAALAQGDIGRAREHVREGLEVASRRQFLPLIGGLLNTQGWIDAAAGRPEVAAACLGAADAIRGRTDHVLHPVDLRQHEAVVSRLQQDLGEGYRDAFEQGRNRDAADTIRLSLDD